MCSSDLCTSKIFSNPAWCLAATGVVAHAKARTAARNSQLEDVDMADVLVKWFVWVYGFVCVYI